MTRKAWIYVGVFVVIALGAAFYIKTKNTDASSGDQSQLPAEDAEANYTVPPDIGASVNAGGGIVLAPNSDVDYTVSQGNSLPITPTATSY